MFACFALVVCSCVARRAGRRRRAWRRPRPAGPPRVLPAVRTAQHSASHPQRSASAARIVEAVARLRHGTGPSTVGHTTLHRRSAPPLGTAARSAGRLQVRVHSAESVPLSERDVVRRRGRSCGFGFRGSGCGCAAPLWHVGGEGSASHLLLAAALRAARRRGVRCSGGSKASGARRCVWQAMAWQSAYNVGRPGRTKDRAGGRGRPWHGCGERGDARIGWIRNAGRGRTRWCSTEPSGSCRAQVLWPACCRCAQQCVVAQSRPRPPAQGSVAGGFVCLFVCLFEAPKVRCR